jgi:hypothetical protein
VLKWTSRTVLSDAVGAGGGVGGGDLATGQETLEYFVQGRESINEIYDREKKLSLHNMIKSRFLLTNALKALF